MEIRIVRLFSFVAALMIAPLLLTAQPWRGWRGSGGWGPASPYGRMYDPTTVESVKGTVESVDRIQPMRGMSAGIHLQLKTDAGSLRVDLGPDWYIRRLDTRIEKGDRVEIRGSRVKLNGKEVLIAAEVRKGDATLVLRDAAGIPAWAGWRR